MAYATDRVREEYCYRCGLKYAELAGARLPFYELALRLRQSYKQIWAELNEEKLRDARRQ
jgi:hypothetical protein